MTTTTLTLTDFLLARIAEDEAYFQSANERNLHDRDRLLAECEAKRRIVAEHESYADYGEHCQTCARYDDLANDPWPCPTLRALALPFADHPDYNLDWRP